MRKEGQVPREQHDPRQDDEDHLRGSRAPRAEGSSSGGPRARPRRAPWEVSSDVPNPTGEISGSVGAMLQLGGIPTRSLDVAGSNRVEAWRV